MKLRFAGWLIVFLSPFMAFNALAAPACANVFQKTYSYKQATNYTDAAAGLEKNLELLSSQKRKTLIHVLDSIEFFDYQHLAPSLFDNFFGDKKLQFNFSKKYDRFESPPKAPFTNFLNVKKFLAETKPQVNEDLFSAIHKIAMDQNVEGLSEGQRGVYRNRMAMGGSSGEFAAKINEQEVIEKNPYLTFKHAHNLSKTSANWKNVKIWGVETDFSNDILDTFAFGHIIYPHPLVSKQETIDLVKETHPQLWNEINVARQISDTEASPELINAFVKALTKDRFDKFLKNVKQLGAVKIGKNEMQYAALVAAFQRDLVSIHPFTNGNGRTTRLLMLYLFQKIGLPPPYIVKTMEDIYVTEERWIEIVQEGLKTRLDLVNDLSYRIIQGLTPEYSPELLYPGLSKSISISEKSQGSVKEIKNQRAVLSEGNQFTAFIKTMMEVHPDLKAEMANNLTGTMSRLAELYSEWFRSKTIDYIHKKDGKQEIKLRFVEQDFIDTFGKVTAQNKQSWNLKIQRWYDRNMLIWRGLSNRSLEMTDAEILEMFSTPSTHLVSNAVLGKLRGGNFDLIQEIKKDFQAYNRQLITGELLAMAKDHHESGPLYATSYGYSTSKREIVGKAFAMGAMVVAPYGQHARPDHQAKLKSRINVASYRAWKDVDLGRLRAFDEVFRYIYGRQAEVMGIGGTDPDAVMIVQRIDASGNVTHSFVRDVNNPAQVHLISGRYIVDEELDPARIIKSFTVKASPLPKTNTPTDESALHPGVVEQIKKLIKSVF